jgi:Fe2+ or Zn2+ uptake regulation protein
MYKHKYKNRKTEVNGIVFHSLKEARRYQELLLLEKAGAIQDLKLQEKFVLIPSQRGKDGKVIERECSYIADFCYKENGEYIVEDTKGFRTKDYIIKRKLMLKIYGIRIKEL